ncbi:MAG: hypothetical protein SFX73_26955, partial [Kofleriaceae bacterium]|nr:hypothetical protein [Kofleriaceae bacterium]
MRLVFEPTRVGDEVSGAAELEAALASKRTPTAALTEIVEIKWGERQLDHGAIREIVDAYHDWPARNALRERYGLADYDAVLRIVLHGRSKSRLLSHESCRRQFVRASGLRVTVSGRSHERVGPAHRSGWRSRA